MLNLWQRLRGAVGNAVVWSVGWLLAGVAIISVVYALGLAGGRTFLESAGSAASSFAVLGFLAGGAFSIYLGSVGRRKQLHELRAGRTAVVAGLLTAVSVPLFRIGLEALGLSFIVPIEVVLLTSVLPGVLGGLTAFGTIRVAQGSLGPGRQQEHVGPFSTRSLPDSTRSP